MSFRGWLYKLGKYLGDWNALKSGSAKKMTKRAGRRFTGKFLGKIMRKLF